MKEQIDILSEEVTKIRERIHHQGNELATMGLKIDELREEKITLTKLDTQVSVWMNTTDEYRKSLCAKIDKIMQKFEDLPCKERGEMYRGVHLTTKLVWGAIAITFAILVAHLGWK